MGARVAEFLKLRSVKCWDSHSCNYFNPLKSLFCATQELAGDSDQLFVELEAHLETSCLAPKGRVLSADQHLDGFQQLRG